MEVQGRKRKEGPKRGGFVRPNLREKGLSGGGGGCSAKQLGGELIDLT